MDISWNSTYLMLKHLLSYKDVFHVWLNSNYGSELLTAHHWYVAEQIMVFLQLFYEATVVLSGVYYPTAPLVLHHILNIAEHLHKAENDQNFRSIAYPMTRDVMSVPVSTVSSESCFNLTSRILEDRRRRLLPEHLEMLTCMKDWEQGVRREEHAVEDPNLEEAFNNLFLDEEGEGSDVGTAAAG
jgi:hypothetical protein